MNETGSNESHEIFTHRDPGDLLGEYTRFEIDRDAGMASSEFRTSDGVPLLGLVVDTARAQGSYSILDAGCGTGRTLYDIKDQIDFRVKVPVHAVGINDQDFSQESERAYVRKAMREHEIDYRIENLDSAHFESPEFDLVFSFEVLIHNDNFDKIALNLIDGVNKGGYMFLNLLKEQIDSPKWQGAKQRLSEIGDVREYGIKRGDDMRFYVEVNKY